MVLLFYFCELFFNSFNSEKRNKKAHILPPTHEHMHIKDFIQYMSRNHVKNLEKNFILMAKKVVNENEKEIYMTKQSIIDGFESVFGYKNDSLAKRLYLFLSKRQPNSRISFETFIRRCFKLIYSEVVEKNMISFSFYDFDGNGAISTLDIYELTKWYQEGSKLHQESSLILQDIINNLLQGRARKSSDYFNYSYFSYMVRSSYISKEIVNKIANGITSISFHDAKDTPKWDRYLSTKGLMESSSKSFINIIMVKTKKKQKEKEEKEKVHTQKYW